MLAEGEGVSYKEFWREVSKQYGDFIIDTPVICYMEYQGSPLRRLIVGRDALAQGVAPYRRAKYEIDNKFSNYTEVARCVKE